MAPNAITDPQVVLVTSDDPPIRVTVSRLRLCQYSKTFEDCLSVPASTDEGATEPVEIPVVEEHKKLKGFLKVFRGEDVDTEGEDGMAFSDWLELAEVADKYDSSHAMGRVREKIWCLIDEGTHLSRAFYLAIALKNTGLISRTCGKAIDEGLVGGPLVPKEWADRLAYSFQVRKIKLFQHYLETADDAPTYEGCTTCTDQKLATGWTAAVTTTIANYKLSKSFKAQLLAQLKLHLNAKCAAHTPVHEFALSYGKDMDEEMGKYLEIVDSYTIKMD